MGASASRKTYKSGLHIYILVANWIDASLRTVVAMRQLAGFWLCMYNN